MTMRAHGAYTCLISGGFTLFTNAVAAKIGFQENRANELVVRDGKFTGEVKEPILGRATVHADRADGKVFKLDDIDTMVAGDGANDLGMIDVAGLGVTYHAKPAVAARRRGADRLWRPRRAPLCAGVSARGVCGGLGHAS